MTLRPTAALFAALGSPSRLSLLYILGNPALLPVPKAGQVSKFGVSVGLLARAAIIDQSTASRGLQRLEKVGLVFGTEVTTESRVWVHYRRDERTIAHALRLLEKNLKAQDPSVGTLAHTVE